MTTKHYDINYLQNTRQLLLNLKEQSYTFFSGVTEGTILDLGCGAGNDVIGLARAAHGGVKVVGADHDPQMIEQGKTQANGMDNIEFILSEAYPLPFENESLSGVRAERLIQHLKNPGEVMGEINRVLKKDAPLVVIETDWNSLSFYTGFVDVQKKVNTYLTDVKVNNGFAAQKLGGYLEANGFKNITFEVKPFVINTLEEANAYFWIEKIVKEASEKGYIEHSEYENFYKALQKADDAHYFSCAINLVLVSCIK